jgi:hypothetical protein
MWDRAWDRVLRNLRLQGRQQRRKRLGQSLLLSCLAGSLGVLWPQPAAAQLNGYCQFSQSAIDQKETLRQAALSGEAQARSSYEQLLQEHARQLRSCRDRTWPQHQAVWIRLYPCDLQPGVLDAVMDRITNLGYTQVYVEAFYNGQVLLPSANNPTVWPSVVNTPGYENRDLLAESIAAGRKRGLEVHAWMFALNYGYTYGQRRDRNQVLARNGTGTDSLTWAGQGNSSNAGEVFVDPYSPVGQADYQQVLNAILRRQPDGVLFDYIRYPLGTGGSSVAGRVADLWIYGDSARQAFVRRGTNRAGQDLIQRFLSQGYLTEGDVARLSSLYPDDPEPMWQGRERQTGNPPDLAQRRNQLQSELWRLSLAHAVQGVLDFFNQASRPVQQAGLPAGAVFFPNGNRSVGQGGYDSRLQHWQRFPTSVGWHPMSYAVCGRPDCIVEEVQRVMVEAGPRGHEFVKPVLAGAWGQSLPNRPTLEAQMQALQRAFPNLRSVSHFAYSWQDPEFDRARKFCRL